MDISDVNDSGRVLPHLYGEWVEELLGGAIPVETEATCDDCAMCLDDTAGAGSCDFFFDRKTKCCTFVPELPNFLVGRMLEDDGGDFAVGRAIVEKRLEEGVGVTPLGISPSPTDQLLYEHTTQSMAFGRNPNLRCPHYLGESNGRCGIWQYRTSACATWFCKHVRGAVGFRFWRSVHQLLLQVERDLKHWCVCELDVGIEALRKVVPLVGGEPESVDPVCEGRLDGRLRKESYKTAWGNWLGREQEFFRVCGQLVKPLGWGDVREICSPEIRILEQLAAGAYKNLLSDEVPSCLKVGGFNVLQLGQEFHRIEAYSPLDPITVSRVLVDVLHYFDGRPTDDVVREIALETGLELDNTHIRKLIDFGIIRD